MDKDKISFLCQKQQEYEHDYGMEMDRLGEDIGEDVIRVYRQWMLPLYTVITDAWNISKFDQKWAVTVMTDCQGMMSPQKHQQANLRPFSLNILWSGTHSILCAIMS